MTKKILLASVSILTLAIAVPEIARSEVLILDTITVLGTRTAKTVFESPRSISVVPQEEIEKKAPESLAEMLRDVPGVQILDSSVAGMKRIQIRGESSRRNVIMVDGQEITDHSTYGTPILIDPSSVERIEVIKGPASVLYGSKAIGGVINIITKKGGDKPIEGVLSGTYFSATKGYHTSATVLGSWENWDYRVTGSLANHGDRKTAGGILENSSFKNDTISSHLGYRAGNHYFSVKAEQYKMEADSYVDPSTLAPIITRFELALPQRDRRKLGLFYDATDLTPWLKKIHFDAYYQVIDRLFKQDLTTVGASTTEVSSESDDKGITKGATVQFDTQPLPNHKFIFGGQFLDDNLDVIKTSDVTITPPGMMINTVNTDDANIKTYSLFAQDEWTLVDTVKLTGGLRFYHVGAELKKSNHTALTKNSDDRVVGSLAMTYSGIQNILLRAVGSQGYVYPTLLQLFVDTPFGGGGDTFGNSALKPETSNNVEIGGRYRGGGFVFDTAVFYTQAEDYISRQVIGGGPDGTWMNVDKAITYGAELFAEYKSNMVGNLTPYVKGSWKRRQFKTDTYSTYKTNTAALTGRMGVKFNWALNETLAGWGDVYMRGATKAELEDATGDITKQNGWATLNLAMGVNVGPKKNMQVVLNFNNITNKDYTPANEIPGVGRSFELTTRVKF